MKKSLFSIVAAGAFGLSACASTLPENKAVKDVPVNSVAPVSSLGVLAREVYALAANSPDGVYVVNLEGALVGVKSGKPVNSNVRSGDIEVSSDGKSSVFYSDFGEDGVLDGYFTGKSVEGYVFYDKHPHKARQEEYFSLLERIRDSLNSKR